MNTREVYDKLHGIKGTIEKAVAQNVTGSPVMIDPHEVDLENPNDPEELARHDALVGILDKLDGVLYELEYWNSPIESDGVLRKKSNGRYELNGFELTSGMQVEVLTRYFDDDPLRWVRVKVEHDGEDYCLVPGYMRLDGVRARVR